MHIEVRGGLQHLPDEGDYWRRFRIIDADPSQSPSTKEGCAARVEAYGTGLQLAEHKRDGQLAIIWKPGFRHDGYDIPCVEQEPVVVCEFTGRLHRRPGEWIIEFLAKYGIRQSYPSLAEYHRHLKRKAREARASRLRAKQKIKTEAINDIRDRVLSRAKLRRTIVRP